MPIRNAFMLGAVLGGLLAAALPAAAEPPGSELRSAASLGKLSDRVYTPGEKHHYESMGQEYLRSYVREHLMRFAADQGVFSDFDLFQPGATLNLTRWLDQDETNISTRMRILAEDDLRRYTQPGILLPIRVEVESSFYLLPRVRLDTRMDAPLDNYLHLELASRVQWSRHLHSRVQWRLRNDSRLYDGFDLGLGVCLREWQVTWDYGLNREQIHRQRLSFNRAF